ncbi:MlaD family protein [Patulibacter defluvii]|uniref:MlaD family protein n=1 Tax=Patulibacter defluvii TaxID=3095358 RepID=UPI002A765F5C|nr:MlaD family protein [Patulibacter sp. DM4]
MKRNPGRIVAALLAVVAAVVAVIVLTGGDDDSYIVRAEFKDSAGLRKNGDVKIGGVPGGKISAIDLTKRDTAMVTMKLKGGAAPIGRGASAEARPVNLLGEKYVDLNAGDLRQPVRSGTTIALKDTGAPVELDEVLNMLDPSTRGRMRVIINEFGVGLHGRGTDLNALLNRMPSALDQAQRMVGSFAADTERLKALASQGDRVIDSFARGKDDVTELVDVAERTLKVTTANRENLGHTIDTAPSTLRQLRTTLVELSQASRRLKPASRELRRTSGPLADTLARLPRFADDAKPTLAAARRTAPTLAKLGREGAPVVARLEPMARELERFSAVFAPLSVVLDRQTNPLIRVMEGWARAIQTRDNAGHLFRTEAVPTEELATHLVGKLGTKGQPGRPQDTGPPPIAQDAPLRRAPVTKSPEPTPQRTAPPAGGADQLLDYLLG